MDTIRENAQKVLVAAIVLCVIFLLITILIAQQDHENFVLADEAVILALETFNFRSNFGIILLFLSLFIGVFSVYLLELIVSLVRNEFGGVIYMAQTVRFKNHYIVCGGGRIGERIAYLLKERHKPVLIVESNDTRAAELKRAGYKVMKESALEEKTFQIVNAKKAVAVFACLGQDVDNFLVVLNARAASKDVKIITRCNSVRNVNKFKQLGATEVILPEIVGADRMVYLVERENKNATKIF